MGGQVTEQKPQSARLNEAQLLQAAQERTGLHDWGADLSFRKGLSILIEAAEEMQAPPQFYDEVRKRISHVLETRLRLVEDARLHPEIVQQRIENPIAVIGLPRTGTTITYDLLTLDPAARAPREFELFFPWPATEEATFTTDPRIAIVQAMQDNFLAHAPQLAEIQRTDCTQPGECNHGMVFHFAGSNLPAEYGVPKFAQWVIDEIPEGLYRTHKRLLQEFQWKGPKGRWVIKSPHHLFDLEGMVQAYPDIGLVWTHRDPVSTLSSLSSFFAALQAAVGQGKDLHAIGRSVVDMWCAAMARATRVRAANPAIEGRIIDIAHRDVVLDPIGSMRKIYDRFKLPLTADVERRMVKFLAENPSASRLGKHKHSPEQFGIDPAEVHARLAVYYDRFGHLLAKP
jgi:Sulfotransferase family